MSCRELSSASYLICLFLSGRRRQCKGTLRVATILAQLRERIRGTTTVRHCFLISAKMGRKDSVETIKQIFKEQSTALRRYKTDKLGATAAKNTAPNISHLLKQATMLWIRLDRDFSSPATHLFRT